MLMERSNTSLANSTKSNCKDVITPMMHGREACSDIVECLEGSQLHAELQAHLKGRKHNLNDKKGS
jgi:hypothetical protein